MYKRQPYRCCIYKERAILRQRAIAGLGCSVETDDEMTSLNEYAKQAMERKEPEGEILTVVDAACKGCVPSRVYVTAVSYTHLINYESAKNKALKDLSTAYERLITSQTNLLFYKNKLVKDSAELIRISQKNYKEGKSDLTSVIMMQQSFREIVTGYNLSLIHIYRRFEAYYRKPSFSDRKC